MNVRGPVVVWVYNYAQRPIKATVGMLAQNPISLGYLISHSERLHM